MNTIAEELNLIIGINNKNLLYMLSSVGKELFFPKGILSQSAEAKEKAYKFNATIGIASENKVPMHFSEVLSLIKKIDLKDFLTYAPSYGIPKLRKKWKELLFLKNNSLTGKKISSPVVTCGVTNGLSIFADMFIDPGDVIIIPSMMWGNYNMIFSVNKKARISQYSLFSEQKGFNIEAFQRIVKEETLTKDKIAILFNFPHNPTGYTITEKEADAIVQILYETAESGTKIIALADDAYFGLVYEDGIIKESIFAKLACSHQNILSVKVDGATKEEFAWGLRVGFITYAASSNADDYENMYEALEKKTAGAVRGNISNASHLSQSLVLNIINSPDHTSEKEEKFNTLKRRALKIKHVLKSSLYDDAWDVYPFNSGYFMCIRLKPNITAEKLRLHLLNNYGVGLISVGEKDLRIAFSSIEENDITELFDIISKGLKECCQE